MNTIHTVCFRSFVGSVSLKAAVSLTSAYFPEKLLLHPYFHRPTFKVANLAFIRFNSTLLLSTPVLRHQYSTAFKNA
jgi:hypothetical protein